MASIECLGSTDNVVEFLISAFARLPKNTLHIINLGSCYGNTFDIRLVAGCDSIPLSQAENDVWRALRAGILYL